MINLVTNVPLRHHITSWEQEFGSYDHYRTVWDATGPLNQSGTIGYRLSGAYQDYGSFRDFQGGRRVFLAPVLAFKPTDRTDLVIDLIFEERCAEHYDLSGSRQSPGAARASPVVPGSQRSPRWMPAISTSVTT
ncbi:MAG: hypothetical protein U0231_08955 [Nitrospiraceae bacterium]